ncbi:hypothetical protein O7602_11720 [Micromonospora sp. WMMD1128]|uniref:hypothetical protein n=1 Tax=unclassified Micromonospora TaxID=2617518 RepID=UPI00248AE469|nr:MULTISPECIES: hypothetical protein [unclassified Micromonospora]WBB76142.1 hypothetical protein O7602_11720 [Micromonospora sp. WMMD1128]WFE36074.1 hypothetical protein O7613_12035 [Micromonospora sp. WMMD975]
MREWTVLNRRIRTLVVAALALPLLGVVAVAAPAAPTPAGAAPVVPAPTVDPANPTTGTHLRLGLRVSTRSATANLLEIDRGFPSSLRGAGGPLQLVVRDTAGGVLDTLALDDPLAVRVYGSKENAHDTPRVKEADVVVDLPVGDTAAVVDVVLSDRRIGRVEVDALIRACRGAPLPCATI